MGLQEWRIDPTSPTSPAPESTASRSLECYPEVINHDDRSRDRPAMDDGEAAGLCGLGPLAAIGDIVDIERVLKVDDRQSERNVGAVGVVFNRSGTVN